MCQPVTVRSGLLDFAPFSDEHYVGAGDQVGTGDGLRDGTGVGIDCAVCCLNTAASFKNDYQANRQPGQLISGTVVPPIHREPTLDHRLAPLIVPRDRRPTSVEAVRDIAYRSTRLRPNYRSARLCHVCPSVRDTCINDLSLFVAAIRGAITAGLDRSAPPTTVRIHAEHRH